MKKILSLAFLFFTFQFLSAQQIKQAEYKEGWGNLINLINYEPVVPKIAKKEGIMGSVTINLSIDETGKVTDMEIISTDFWYKNPYLQRPETEKAMIDDAFRVCKRTYEKWLPATRNGIPEKSKFMLTIPYLYSHSLYFGSYGWDKWDDFGAYNSERVKIYFQILEPKEELNLNNSYLPHFYWGKGDWTQFVLRNFIYPQIARSNTIEFAASMQQQFFPNKSTFEILNCYFEAEITTSFMVSKYGKLSNIDISSIQLFFCGKAVRDLAMENEFKREMLSVLHKMSEWIPAMENGEAIDKGFVFKVYIRL